MLIRTVLLFVLTCALACFAATPVTAQMSASPHSIALGGGIAHSTGVSSHFSNPANLMIRDDLRRHQITLGIGGVYFSNGIPTQKANSLPEDIFSYFKPDAPPDRVVIPEEDLISMFSDTDRHYTTRSYEMIPLGYSWSNGTRAHSIALRSRGISSFEMNSSWFAANEIPDSPDAVFTRSLKDNYQVYHEISFAMAREVTMLNQWQSGLNTLYIGLAPKFLIAGMYSEAEYLSEYRHTGDDWQNSGSLLLRHTGDMNRFLAELLQTGNADQAYRNNFSPSSNFEPGGAGFGIDAGLTYIVPLGDDLSLSPHSDDPLRKSLRFSIALTDLGFIRYHSSATEWQSRNIIRTYSQLPETDIRFGGRPGEFLHYIHNDSGEDAVLDNLATTDESAFYIQLPTELHIGSAFQYNWLTSMVDLNYRFNSPDFNSDGWRLSLGTEVRLLRFFPVMGSFQIDPGGKASIGAGAGMDFGVVKATGAVRFFRSNNNVSRWQVNSLSALALQIRF